MINNFIRNLYPYNTWANRRILDTAGQISPEQMRAETLLPFGTVHKRKFVMLNTVLRVISVIFIGFASGVIGWIIGALTGGNFTEQFVFNGVRGYEATGQIGSILGALIGLISSWRLLFKRKS